LPSFLFVSFPALLLQHTDTELMFSLLNPRK
jgi:hypothetical protein